MDYVKHFGLEREPFQNDVDGRFYFEGASQRRARMQLMRALKQHKGLALVLGGAGLGKTTLALHLMRDLDPQRFAAHLLLSSHRECANGWFLPQVARVYGVSAPAVRVPELIEQIHARLLALRTSGRHPVLFVDEAQLLGERTTLEEFRALLNLAHEGQRVFSLMLFATPEFGHVLAHEPSLAQRVDVRAQLLPLSAEETGAYLAHRLAQAGAGASLLSGDAVGALQLYSGGVLRVLNTLADNACFEAALEDCASVGAEHVSAAAQQLELQPSDATAGASAAAAAFHHVSGETVASRLGASPSAAERLLAETPLSEPATIAPDEPILGESSGESPPAPNPEEDWLEPVAPVLDDVLRTFDDAVAPRSAPADAEPGDVLDPGVTAEETQIADAPDDDPLTWSFLDSSASSIEPLPARPLTPRPETPRDLLPGEDDSLADASFAKEIAMDEDSAVDLGAVLEGPQADLSETGTQPESVRSRGPCIDLPEDADLDSLFDEIQIDR